MRFDFDQCRFVEREQAPHAPALRDAAGVLDWAGLYQATQDWIARAQQAGVQPGHALVISGHKQSAFVVAMLGCLQLGVTYVPVDTINPPARLQRITALVHAAAVYDAAADTFGPGADDARALAVPDLAYIMFTSGSTGDPKGVQIGRDSVALFAGWIRDCLALGPAPAFLNQMLFSFDFSLFDLCGALGLGGCCVLCPREVIADSERFVDHLRDADVAVWASTPSFVRQQLLNPRFCAEHLPTLQVFVFGAESLTPRLAEELWARFPQARIVNSYGPTEATCSTTWVEIDAALRAAAPNPFPIGVAKPYAQVFIDGGEICMAGDHVMRGYLERPDLDQGVLFEHDGKRAYRSGDLGEIDAQGRLYFRGRKDDQIKLNGYRIELAEVDAALSTLDGVVAGAAVVLRRPDGSLVRMIGFVELAAPGAGAVQPLPDALQDWKRQLGQRVPPYMIPSELIAVDALPTGATNKVDRKQLEQRYALARTLRSQETKR
ncbi:AMP-binding protein [Xanthomonas sp. NCPPB 2654]|uniref:AMP-binding protein n=1 Tax=unclassified Xanthomonas TaxID=2643310 RepID=UPI0021E07232|nr:MULTISPECIES: AMP-binding protein [unclassified Xanthomonas]MDL5365135.1 AMP-binding protein [Xanthomonas sp. NCPPB 2654]UYC21558.1 AMP-binding protein [Xanthomonas sp. CFBP 8443]